MKMEMIKMINLTEDKFEVIDIDVKVDSDSEYGSDLEGSNEVSE